MSNILTVDKSLELLNDLKGIIRETVAQETSLTQKFQSRLATETQHREAALESIATRLSDDVASENSTFQSQKLAIQSHYESRSARICEAYKASKQQGLQKIESLGGRRKYRLQTESMQAARTRKEETAATESAYEQFTADLAVENDDLTRLEKFARDSFSGYGGFVRLLNADQAKIDLDRSRDEYQLIEELRELRDKGQIGMGRFRKFILPRFFKYRLLWFLVILCPIPVALVLSSFGDARFGLKEAIFVAVGSLIVGFILHLIGKGQSKAAATDAAMAIVKSRLLHAACLEKTESRHTQELERIENEFQTRNQKISEQWGQALEESEELKAPSMQSIDEKEKRVTQKSKDQHRLRLERLVLNHNSSLERLNQEAQAQKAKTIGLSEEKTGKLTAEYEAAISVLETKWKNTIQPIYQTLSAAENKARELFAPWNPELLASWTAPQTFVHAARFGQLEVDVRKFADNLPLDKRLALPGAARFSVPLLLSYPEQGSILFETWDSGNEAVIDTFNNVILRLLSKAPPGRINFTVLDPVGLGQNFAGVMHLADYEEHLINSRIWTQSAQIEQKLFDLNEHMEKVIQMYLRNEYATIADYNEQAGNIAEKYHVLVVANFPANFTDTAIKRLISIASSGARCGVYTFIHWDHRQVSAHEFVSDELRKCSVGLTCKSGRFTFTGKHIEGTNLLLEAPPAQEMAIDFIHKIGRSSRDSNRVEVPFSHVAPPEGSMWSEDTTTELRVPMGRTGATKLQYLAIGKGTRQHALIAGKTGSGKSTLFHVVITNLALWCSPEQVEFYLVDFKKGVEFKCYAAKRLPHARVIAIESDREFGLSVLQRVDAELKRRGDLFRQLGVQDIAGYKRAGGKEPIPRSLLIIDEFQEFFVEDDKVSQSASLLLDRIVRQGRAFGIHVFLGSQTLGGAYTMARTTMGQMVIRIALQCNEADSYLIMDENNPAPRLLSRPGEGIYNDSAGTLEGNSPFQAVWLPDEVRETYLDKIRDRAAKTRPVFPGPIVFEGDVPADIRENPLLRELLEAPAVKPSASSRIWLGAPNSIKGPTEALFQRQSGNHLLVVGQRDEAVLAIFASALFSLSAQHPAGTVQFIVADAAAPGSAHREFMERLVKAIPHKITLAKNSDLPELMSQLAEDMKNRSEESSDQDAPAIFLLIHDLHKFSKLRYEEDFSFSSSESTAANPAVLLNKILSEGSSRGIHVIATTDTYNNVNRFMNRKALSEFEMRVLFQMSANDSASLIDSPRASTLGLHRALFYNEKEGYLEIFRPYSLPVTEWIEKAETNLRRIIS